jgi:hypothetical protein
LLTAQVHAAAALQGWSASSSSARSTHDVASVTRQHVGVAMLETFQFDGRLSLEVIKNEKSASAVIEDEARRMAANFAKLPELLRGK